MFDIVVKPGLINIRLDDLKEIFSKNGKLFFYTGSEEKVLKNLKRKKADKILIYYECKPNVSLEHMNSLTEKITKMNSLTEKITKNKNWWADVLIGAKISKKIKNPILTVIGVENER